MIDFKKPIKTRDGKSVRIICTDRVCEPAGDNYPVVALVLSNLQEEIVRYTSNGQFYTYRTSLFDLVNIESNQNIISKGCECLSRQYHKYDDV